MEIDLEPGKYILAVSGGVDSVALLDMLAGRPGLELIVAHFDHGIRPDSAEDRRLVQSLTENHGLLFEYAEGNLGPEASEAKARTARYSFLHSVRKKYGAQAIVTAHHQDDVLETAILNLLRGTGRRGLSSLKSTEVIKRPVLETPKKELLRYAERAGLEWREDCTNLDPKYRRNYIRQDILPRFAETDRQVLLRTLKDISQINRELDRELEAYFADSQPMRLDRSSFINFPHVVAREIMAAWLLTTQDIELSRQMLERLVVAAKTGRNGTKVDVNAMYWLEIFPDYLALEVRER
jgi:tRNA(Ile)-lysidine synthase